MDNVDNKNANSEKKYSGFISFFKMLPMFLKASPLQFVLMCIMVFINGTCVGLGVYLSAEFFNKATAFSQKRGSFEEVLFALGVMGVVMLIGRLVDRPSNIFLFGVVEIGTGIITRKMNKKIGKLDPVQFQKATVLDDISKASIGIEHALWHEIMPFWCIMYYVPYYGILSVYLMSIDPILVFAIVALFIPNLLAQVVRQKVFSKLADKSAPILRQNEHYKDCIAGRAYFKETRLLGGYHYFISRFKESLSKVQKLKWSAHIKVELFEMAVNLIVLAGYIGILYSVMMRILVGKVEVGAFAAVYAALDSLFWGMYYLTKHHIGDRAAVFGYVCSFLRFMDADERGGKELEVDTTKDIVLDGVSFAYPNATESAVDTLTMQVKAGETLAIVGENGSGKSTLTRLITGIYKPTSGKVTVGGCDTNEVNMSSLFQKTSGVFQDYQRYPLTLSSNINISDVNADTSCEKLDKVTKLAGVDVKSRSFDKGYDTMLSRDFEGVDLSGGQWQRVAIARGFYRPCEIIVLDEPTAAIDPMEETRIYNRFEEASRDKTAIIVTHRLGSVKIADRIAMMHKGKLVDVGAHEELIERCPMYLDMWQSQSQYYV